jgi:hypothetical protein
MRCYIMIAAIALQSLECSVNTNHRTGVTASLAPPADIRSGEVATDPEVIPGLWQMLGDAGFGFGRMEQAAFIVREADGRLILVRWPEAGEPGTSRWVGPLPNGVVAIAHTHPNWDPNPSKIDIRTAQQSHLPVYVVTRTEISKTLGGLPQIVLSGDWRPVTRPTCAGEEGFCDPAKSRVAALALIVRKSSQRLMFEATRADRHRSGIRGRIER